MVDNEQPHPHPLPDSPGAYLDLFSDHAVTLLLFLEDAAGLPVDAADLRQGTVGLLYETGALLVLWEWLTASGEAIAMDSFVDVRDDPSAEIDITQWLAPRPLHIRLVDADTGQLIAKADATLPIEFGQKLLAALIDQVQTLDSGDGVLSQWLACEPDELVSRTERFALTAG